MKRLLGQLTRVATLRISKLTVQWLLTLYFAWDSRSSRVECALDECPYFLPSPSRSLPGHNVLAKTFPKASRSCRA